GPGHKDTLGLLRVLTHTLFDLRRFDDAEPALRLLRQRQKEALAADDPEHLNAALVLAHVQHQRGRLRESAELFEEVRGLAGPDSPRHDAALEWLAYLYAELKDHARGIPVCEELRKRRGKDHADHARLLGQLARLRAVRGEYDAAADLLGEAWEVQRGR